VKDPVGYPVIVEATRTPIGKRLGWLSGLHAAELLGAAQRGVVERAGIDPELVEPGDRRLRDQGGEPVQQITLRWLHAGLPWQTGATTIDAQCGSAHRPITSSPGCRHRRHRLGVACGIKPCPSAAGAPTVASKPVPQTGQLDIDLPNQFLAAERVAQRRGLTRADLGCVRSASQQNAKPRGRGAVRPRGSPRSRHPSSRGRQPTGELRTVTRDQGMRETTIEGLGTLKSVYEAALHTAGTSSQISDGALRCF